MADLTYQELLAKLQSELLSAQQGYDATALALGQQRGELNTAYDRQLSDSAENYQNAYSQADRAMLGRGMQRSSYGQQILSRVSTEGNKAANDINTARTSALGNLGAQGTQLAKQLAQRQALLNEQIARLKAANGDSGGGSGGGSGGSLPHWARLGYPSLAAYQQASREGLNYKAWKAKYGQGTNNDNTTGDGGLNNILNNYGAVNYGLYDVGAVGNPDYIAGLLNKRK